MKRIIIVGSPGSGKSTLAKILSEKLALPLVHLDKLYWNEGWRETDAEKFAALVSEAAAGDSWIIDGNYLASMQQRISRADTVIMLDMPRRVCMWRILKRIIKNRGEVRSDMAEGCPEKFDLEFLLYVWSFKKTQREKVLELVRNAGNIETFVLKNKREYTDFLAASEKL